MFPPPLERCWRYHVFRSRVCVC